MNHTSAARAEQALARSSQNLRHQVDLETIQRELVGVIAWTVQPSQVILLVREVKRK